MTKDDLKYITKEEYEEAVGMKMSEPSIQRKVDLRLQEGIREQELIDMYWEDYSVFGSLLEYIKVLRRAGVLRDMEDGRIILEDPYFKEIEDLIYADLSPKLDPIIEKRRKELASKV